MNEWISYYRMLDYITFRLYKFLDDILHLNVTKKTCCYVAKNSVCFKQCLDKDLLF